MSYILCKTRHFLSYSLCWHHVYLLQAEKVNLLTQMEMRS